jgi:hypothetical protein
LRTSGSRGGCEGSFEKTILDSVLAGKILSLTPFETADQNVVWVCGNEFSGVGLNPLGFAAGGPQAEQVVTAIEDRYLPPACR